MNINIKEFKKELKELLEKYSVNISFECNETQGISGEYMSINSTITRESLIKFPYQMDISARDFTEE